jgi:hypothetical protein
MTAYVLTVRAKPATCAALFKAAKKAGVFNYGGKNVVLADIFRPESWDLMTCASTARECRQQYRNYFGGWGAWDRRGPDIGVAKIVKLQPVRG